ncbi:adenosylcobinamide-GDP ribazoletransferase [Psychromonas sp. Urea-02u-13]|uniref:adenosylcobinamide-GDP ribazoletransferase n=1 Tax=Psychromonas sp. Urea-02u-13 TaxID=2058326 RepID=UPI0012FE90A1|nr:adenosylcobinamide-GDP ribazoletransferase [Psychromonas sp. Urea-02u-13]
MLKLLKKQLTLIFYALSYFTRVPIPASIEFDNQQFHKANAYLPFIGLFVAIVMSVIFYLCLQLFSVPVSIILMLVTSLLLTGALHEDGFADCCDGLGGGYDATQRLKIMKDSQIGTYGGIGLILLFLLKFNLLIELADISFETLIISLLVAHTLSRYGALCIMQAMPYVRLAEAGKVQSLTNKLNSKYFVFASLVTAVLTVLLLFSLSKINTFIDIAVVAPIVTLIVAVIVASLYKLFDKNLAGYTGDCLGFTQQSLELSILLALTVLLAR